MERVMQRLDIFLILLLWECAFSRYIALTPLRVRGMWNIAGQDPLPAAFFCKSKVEIIESSLEGSGKIVLCDIFGLPVSRPDYVEPKGTIFDICNRDGGIYDNLPYAWKGKGSKKALFDMCNYDLNKDVLSSKLPSVEAAFAHGVTSVLGAEITAVLIEISDERSSSQISLGGSMIVSRTETADSWKSLSSRLPPCESMDERVIDHASCIANCHIDEVVAFSLALGMPVYVTESLFDKVCVDGLLSESGGAGAAMAIRAPAVPVPVATKSRRGSDDDDGLPIWEIYNANKLLGLSSLEKRALLRRSGVSRLPRPRQGSKALDDLMVDLMDDAVRDEYFRVQARASTASSVKSRAYRPVVAGTAGGGGGGVAVPRSGAGGDEDMEGEGEGESRAQERPGGSSRQELLRAMGEALDRGDIKRAEELREKFAMSTVVLADPTQRRGSYDRFLDQDDWYLAARRRAMQGPSSPSPSPSPPTP